MLIGHQRQWEFLKKTFKLGRIPHAYLFCGQKHLGKRTLASEFIKLINCQAPPPQEKPCQNCRSCKDIGKNQHPDFYLVEPAEGEIKITQIRNLNAKLSLCSFSAPFKTAILDEAHCLNQESQSALLKLLEEPRGRTLLILISEYPEMLLPTILSRVETIKFYPLPNQEIENCPGAEKISRDTLKEIVKFSFGRPGLALDFIQTPARLESQKKLESQILKMGKSDFASRFQYAKELSENPREIKEILEIWLRFFRRVLLEEMKNLTPSYSLPKIRGALNNIQNINFLISTTNVNLKMALEILMLEI